MNKMTKPWVQKGCLAWDDVTGAALDPVDVRRARLEEIEFSLRKGVYTKVSRTDAIRRGIRFLRTRWVDVNKGDAVNTNHRSRFAAMEFNAHRIDGLFTSTPPLKALKLLIWCTATMLDKFKEEEDIIMVNDVA